MPVIMSSANSRRDPTRYLFVDGNYFEVAYRGVMQAMFGDDGDVDFSQMRVNGPLMTRVYYYHSLDEERRKDEKEDDYQNRVEAQRNRFDKINALDGFHVRLGSVKGKQGKEPRTQKQVDVWLAVEMLTHAHSHNMDEAYLLAGDLDFKPAVDAVVNLGVVVRVMCELKSGARRLYRAADSMTALDIRRFYEWSTEAYKRTHKLPSVNAGSNFTGAGLADCEIVKTGRFDGREAKLLRGYKTHYIWIDPGSESRQPSLQLIDDDPAKLERFFTLVFGEIQWTGASTPQS